LVKGCAHEPAQACSASSFPRNAAFNGSSPCIQPFTSVTGPSLPDSDDNGWELQDSSPQISSAQRKLQRDAKLSRIANDARDYLRAHAIESKTTCVFMDAEGRILFTGENQGLAKLKQKSQARDELQITLVKNKSQATGFGGVACAEPDALMKWKAAKRGSARIAVPCYSLAYDQRTGACKPACKSCEGQLATESIIDLHDWL
jgi:hypothetical protein